MNNFQPQNYDPDAKYVLNIFFTFINDDNGQNNANLYFGETYGEYDAMEIIKILNLEFNQFNIFFKYKGFRVVNNTFMTNGLQNLPSIPNVYNFYLMNSNGTANSAVAILGNTQVKINYEAYEREYGNIIVIHEMGHLLGLYHTFQNYNINDPNNIPEGNCERVTRDVNSPFYNAHIAGDRVEDTPACMPYHTYDNCIHVFNPNETDCSGIPYENVIPANYMSYEFQSNCSFHFTTGQGVRMRSHLQNPTYPHVLLTYNTIESLYEPFEITDYGGNVVFSVEDNGDGTAEVCRNLRKKHRFQKGFDYVFYSTFGDDPSTAIYDELPVVKNSTASFYVQINQVNPAVSREVFVDCNRGFYCSAENFVKGLVVSTPLIGSYNFTVKELNEMEVKDPGLYETLLNQFYHIINKETESGAIKHTIIYKQ